MKRPTLVVCLSLAIAILLAAALFGWRYSSSVARPIEAGSLALRRSEWERAVASYQSARLFLEDSSMWAGLCSADFNDAVLGEMQALLQQGQYQQALQLSNQRADSSPEFARDARRLLWTGNLWFRRAIEESTGETLVIQRREQLNAALDFFRKALEANPTDWETKFNFELVSAVIAQENPIQREKKEDDEKRRLLPRIRTDQQRERRVLPPEDRG